VVSTVLRDMLVGLGVRAERLLVVPNGVHLEPYQYADREATRRLARQRLELPPGDGLVLGFVGFYRKWHRLDLAVRCLARPGFERARLVLVGAGPSQEKLAAAAGELGVAERVHFAGTRPHLEIPELLTAFDIALVPGINLYASPLKLQEYLAAGLAVVAPDQSNLREVLVDGENALLFHAGNQDDLHAALLRLARDAELRGRLGEAGRRTILERDLTWRANARRVAAAVADRLASA